MKTPIPVELPVYDREGPEDNLTVLIEVTTLKTLIRYIRHLEGLSLVPSSPILEPMDPGAYNGDEFYGDPTNSTRVTHLWEHGKWTSLPLVNFP